MEEAETERGMDMRGGVALTVGVLLVGVAVESAVRWSQLSAHAAVIQQEQAAIAAAPWSTHLPGARAQRLGVLPSFSHAPAEAGRRGCRMRIDGRSLAHLSDEALQAAGIPGHSPVVVMQDGEPLTALDREQALSAQCEGRSSFTRSAVIFTPTHKPAPETDFALSLSPLLPLEAESGPVWWVYPGGGVELTFDAAEPLHGTELTLRVVARTVGEASGAATLSVDGAQTALRDLDGVQVGSVPVVVPRGAWSLLVTAPEDAPAMVIEKLQLSDGERRVDLLETVL